MTATLQRIVSTNQGTLGKLKLGLFTLYTIERSKDGEHPRIDAGTYKMKLDWYHKGDYQVYQVIVPGRDRILIHAANSASELLGCIAPGMELGYLDEKIAVMKSRLALQRFMDSMGGKAEDYLVVNNPVGE